MALKLWMPLDGSLRNLGTSTIRITPTGTETYSSGKLTQGLTCDGSSHWKISGVSLGQKASICCWAKTSSATRKMPWVIGATAYHHLNLYFATNNTYCLNSGDGYQNPYLTDEGTAVATLNDGLWHHFVVTFDGTESLLYIDGTYAGKTETYISPATTSDNVIQLAGGFGDSSSYDWIGDLNDFRVYDECLSVAEIKEIAKALVCHWKLDDIYSVNLVENGHARYGLEGWTSGTTLDASDYPSVAGCSGSFQNGWSTSYTLIDSPYSQYNLSLYVKSGSSNSYPSIEPCDDDMLRMSPHMVTGFHSTARTTLSQELKPGDTVVHCTSLSNFVTSGYYTRLAIFGYKSNNGKVYEDFTYTRDAPAFTLSNINTSNNTITLDSAFDGEYRPAGTAICQSQSGAQYWYPFGAITSSSNPNWTLKETSFIPNDIPLLKYATYMRYITYLGDGKVACVQLNKEKGAKCIADSSGYAYHGTSNKLLNYSSSTEKYDRCLDLSSSSEECINCGQGGEVSDAITISMWSYMESWTDIVRFISCTQSGGWSINGTASRVLAFTIYINGSYIFALSETMASELSSGWHHFVGSFDGLIMKFYIDGQLVGTSSSLAEKTAIPYHATAPIIIGAEATATASTTPYFNGKISDVRIYATALSDSDIASLYNTSAKLDNYKNFHYLKSCEHKVNHWDLLNKAVFDEHSYNYGLYRYNQNNCTVTVTENGVRIYRPPNLNPTDDGNTMFGGLRIRNDNNQFGLIKNHSYLWAMTISGASNNQGVLEITNNMGYTSSTSGLSPNFVTIAENNVSSNFTGEDINIWKAFTIPDDIWKECTTSYSIFSAGNTYVSYEDFSYTFTYQDTGTLGTDIYLKNFRLYDITDLSLESITKSGIANFVDFVEQSGTASINSSQEFMVNKLIEV